MSAHHPRRGPHPRTAARQAAARLRRLAAALAAVICAVLASAAIVPAASARSRSRLAAACRPGAACPRGHRGGMAGWQIT